MSIVKVVYPASEQDIEEVRIYEKAMLKKALTNKCRICGKEFTKENYDCGGDCLECIKFHENI